MIFTEIEKLHIRQANKFVERIQPKWSSITQRFFLYCIAKVNKNKEHFEKIEVNISDLPIILGYEKNTKLKGNELKDIYEQLNKYSSVQIIDEELKIYKAIFLFEEIEFNTQSDKITILFSKTMREQILQLNIRRLPFTDIKYKEVVSMNGSYSSRLIELLHQYRLIGKRTFTINELRNFLSVPINSYKIFKDFKKRVIDQAIKEINDNKESSIVVEYSTFRVGRSIGKIEFIIRIKKKITIAEQQILIAEKEAATTLIFTKDDLQTPELARWLDFNELGN